MRTIRENLTRKLLAVLILLYLIAGVGIFFLTRTALLNHFDATLLDKANALSSVTEQHGREIEVEFTEPFMRGFDESVATDFFQVFLPDGSTARRSKSLGSLDLVPRFAVMDKPVYWDFKLPSGVSCRAIAYHFTPRRGRNEKWKTIELSLVVASNREPLDANLFSLALVHLAGAALLIFATLMVVPRVLRRELSSLNELADQASRINVTSLSTRFPTEQLPGELRPISGGLNDLLERLENSFQREREFSADLAHELRTPIAELRNLSELALKWPESRPPETDRDALAIALQMEGIVVRLLDLLRAEGRQLPIASQEILLEPLIDSAWLPVAALAMSKTLQVTRNFPEALAIESDPIIVKSILSNLIENAVEYSPVGGELRLDCQVESGFFQIRIANTVDNLTPADLPKLFQRFWRKDASRSGGHHSGLGLSLARSLASALGGSITAHLTGPSQLTLFFSGPTGRQTPGRNPTCRQNPELSPRHDNCWVTSPVK